MSAATPVMSATMANAGEGVIVPTPKAVPLWLRTARDYLRQFRQ